MKPTLSTLIEQHRQEKLPANAYVRERGFSSLYVRLGSRYRGEQLIDNCLDIANVNARKPGNGAFTCLVRRLHEIGFNLYVECVQLPRFQKKLERMGFQKDGSKQGAPSFWLLAADELQDEAVHA